MYTHTHTATVLSLHFAGRKKGTGDDEKREEKDEKHQNEKRTEKEGASEEEETEENAYVAGTNVVEVSASIVRQICVVSHTHTHTHTHASVYHAHIHESAASTNAAGQA